MTGFTDWRYGLPSEVVKKMQAIMFTKTNGRWHTNASWWVRCTPTTGHPQCVDLVQKTRSGRIVSVEPVLRDGEPVGRFA